MDVSNKTFIYINGPMNKIADSSLLKHILFFKLK